MIKFKRNYPNIMLIAEDRYDIEPLRAEISSKGIYVHGITLTGATDELSYADTVIIYSPQYSSRASELYEKLTSNEKVPHIIYVGSETDIAVKDDACILPDNAQLIANEILRVVREDYKIDPVHAEDDEILCELGKPPQVYYNGTKIALSKSEAKIVHFLLTLEPRLLVSKEIIGEYLSLAPGAVPVHIHNINDKSMQTYHDKLIFSRSSRGYFVY